MALLTEIKMPVGTEYSCQPLNLQATKGIIWLLGDINPDY